MSSQTLTDETINNDSSLVVIKEEKLDATSSSLKNNSDDDDVIVLPPQEPVVTEILDEGEENEDDLEKNQLTASTCADDDVLIQEPKIDTHLVYDDDEEKPENDSQPPFTHQPMMVTVKEEPKDAGYGDLVNEEDAFVEVTSINEDFINGEKKLFLTLKKRIKLFNFNSADDTHSPFQPAALDENAIFDETSLLMSHPSSHVDGEQTISDDGNSRPDSTPALIGGNKKLKIVLSSAALVQQSNLKNTNVNINSLSNVHDQTDTNSISENVNKLDSNSLVNLHREENAVTSGSNDADGSNRFAEKELAFEYKPHLRDFNFERNSVPVKRGFENSGLCSIM